MKYVFFYSIIFVFLCSWAFAGGGGGKGHPQMQFQNSEDQINQLLDQIAYLKLILKIAVGGLVTAIIWLATRLWAMSKMIKESLESRLTYADRVIAEMKGDQDA